MKVLLLFKPNPDIVNIQQNIIPNGLLYIASYLLDNNIDVEIVNLALNDWDECKTIIKEKNPDIVGITCFTFNRHTSLKLAEIVKKINKEIKVIFGGPHASIMHNQLLQSTKNIDIIILNEGEIVLFEVIKQLKEKKPLNNLSGIIFKENGQMINNSPRKNLENIDLLPLPSKYFKYKRIMTARGCPGRCIFCDTPFLWGQKVRMRSPKNVVDELEMLNKRHGISSFIFSDDTFTYDKERTFEICREILKRGLKITWDCRSRVNFISEEIMSWIKKAGCVSISYGIESGSQKMLNIMKKGITIEQIKKAAEMTRKFGLNLNFFLIVGTPGETDETINETAFMIQETKPHSIMVYIMQLTPGTEICRIAKSKNFIDDDIWINDKGETISYSAEKTMIELGRYQNSLNLLFSKLKSGFQYTEEELINIMQNQKGVQDLINLAHIRMSQKRYVEAENMIDKSLILNDGSSEALMNKAVLLAMKKDKNCIDFFEKSLVADPENIQAFKNFGVYLYKEGKIEEAKDIFRNASEIEPADTEILNNLGSLYGMQKKFDEAINIFKRIQIIDPQNKEAKSNLQLTIRNRK